MSFDDYLKMVHECQSKQLELVLEKKKTKYGENLALIAFLNGREFCYIVGKFYDDSVVLNSEGRIINEYYHGMRFSDLTRALEFFRNYK